LGSPMTNLKIVALCIFALTAFAALAWNMARPPHANTFRSVEYFQRGRRRHFGERNAGPAVAASGHLRAEASD
jgi:hypothetical protein